MTFIHDDFLLSSKTAETLYHQYAEPMPIIDYHCHLEPEAIAEDRKFTDIVQLWLGGDHYKWRLMRSCGIDERYITGDAPAEEKFAAWACTLERSAGNPLYHWSMLELKRYFGYDGVLTTDNWRTVWAHCRRVIESGRLSARQIMIDSHVQAICTTDNPEDDLRFHQRLKEDERFPIAVLPAFRPDRAMNVEAEDFSVYIRRLGDRFGKRIEDYETLLAVLAEAMDHFQCLDCRTADHGLTYIPYKPADADEADRVFRLALKGEKLCREEEEAYKTRLLLDLAEQYACRGWVMQLHYGARRNNNARMFRRLGPDTGYDCIWGGKTGENLPAFLNTLEEKDVLPKTIVYSLDPTDNAMLDTVCGCFHQAGCRGKVQHGSAWWFNDHLRGMREHLEGLAADGVLGNFIGMLTDSRSFLSYTRHEYFRRILCELLGEWAEKGLYPMDMAALGRLVQDISYYNICEYFGLNERLKELK